MRIVAAIDAGTLRPHRGQLRQPGHGRPHRRLGCHRGGVRGRSTAASSVSRRRCSRWTPRPWRQVGAGALLAITADHGNADVMRDAAGAVVTAHSLSPVPFLLAGSAAAGIGLRDGVLADVAPTLLGFVDLPLADGMTGSSVVVPPTAGYGTGSEAVLSCRPSVPRLAESPRPVNPHPGHRRVARLDRAHRGRSCSSRVAPASAPRSAASRPSTAADAASRRRCSSSRSCWPVLFVVVCMISFLTSARLA